MVFTKSLLIKALGGVAGVGGTGVGVLAVTTDIFTKSETNTPPEAPTVPVNPKVPSGASQSEKPVNKDAGSQGVVVPPGSSSQGNSDGVPESQDSKGQGATKEQDSIQGGSSVGQESIQTGSSAPENQERSTNDGGGSGGGNLTPDTVQSPEGEVQNRSTDVPGGLPSSSNVVENTVENGVSEEEQKGQVGKESGKTVDTKENVSERQGSPQPGTESRDEQVSDPNNAQNGIQTAQDGQDNGLNGSPIRSGLQSPQQPVSGEQNSPNTLPSEEGEGGNKEQQDSIQDGSVGQGSQQSEAKNPTNPDSGADSHRTQTSDISQPSNSTPQAGQPGGDSGDSTPSGSPGTPGATDAQDPSTGGDGSTGGSSGSSGISTTDQATQSQSKEEKINAKLEKLGLPKDKCNFAKDETTKTCSISEKELNQIKFEGSDDNSDEEVSGSETKNFQLKIEILTGNKKTDYGFNDSEDENNLLFTLSGIQNQIEVVHGDLTIEANTNPEFKIEDNKLKKLWDSHSDLAEKVGIKVEKSTNGSFKEDTTSLKYSLDGTEDSIKTLNSPTTSGTIRVEPDKENYNQGVKVTFREKVTSSGGSDSLEKGDYEIKYKDGDDGGWYLSKVTQTTGDQV